MAKKKHNQTVQKPKVPAPSTSRDDYVKRSAEMLLVGSVSSDPFSTIVVDPRTGVSSWSFKGNELQGAEASTVLPLGNRGEHFLFAIQNRPLLHAVAIHCKDRYHAKAVLSGPIQSLCTNPEGTLLFAGIRTQLYIWLLTSGELLSVVDAFFQNVSRITLSSDSSFLIGTADDGRINVYLVTDLLAFNKTGHVSPICSWIAHSNKISDLHVTFGNNPRILTCGLDHIATIHSVSLNKFILKISADRPLTACTMDPAETRLFLGTDAGNVAIISLYDKGDRDEMLIQTSDEHSSAVPVLNGHCSAIRQLAVNGDGCLLASGDADGKYCIWDITSRQCLKVASMRGPIGTLRFIPNWKAFSSTEDHLSSWKPAFELQKSQTDGKQIVFEQQKPTNTDDYWNDVTDRLIANLLNGVTDKKPSAAPVVVEEEDKDLEVIEDTTSSEVSSARIQTLETEVKRLKAINKQLYEFAASEIVE